MKGAYDLVVSYIIQYRKMVIETKIAIAILIIVIIALALVVIFTAKKGKNNIMQNTSTENSTIQTAKAVYHKVSPSEGKQMLDSDKSIILVDVRTQDEYSQGKIAGSILIPDYDIAALSSSKLPDKNAKIIVYCRSGARSQGAAKKLVSL